MAVETLDPEKLARLQAEAISGFFGMVVPKPGDWLFEVVEKNRTERLFDVRALAPFYLPGRQLVEGVSFPGLEYPLAPWLYDQIRAGNVVADADSLPEGWLLLDVIKRPDYKSGKQMYPDTPRFMEMLADLRDLGQVAVPDSYRHVPKNSRFAVSPDEIDGKNAAVANAVAAVLGIKTEQVATPLYVVFNYVGNLAHPEFGQVNTAEWFKNNFRRGDRLFGGRSGVGSLESVSDWLSGGCSDSIGFRLQVSSPSKA